LEELGASSDAVAITRVVVLRSTTETYVLNLFARQLELALRESPDPTDRGKLRLELATSLRKLGKRDEALVHLREFKPGEVSSPELVKRLARLLIDAGDHRAAFDHIKNIPLDEEAKTLVNDITLALEREGEMDTALYLLQYINSNDAALKEAMELKERTIELDAELQFAELHAKGGRFGEAFRKFVEVILAGYEPVDEVLGQVDAILAKLPISAYGGLLQLGAHCLKIERFQQAIHYLNRVLQAYPDEREALALLRKAYDKIIEVHPTVLEVRFKSGRLYERMGERDKAIEEFERCLASEELRNRARREIALCRVHAREHDKALAQYAKMRIEEEDCEPLYAIYEACRDRNPKRALDALGLVRKCNPQYRDIVAKIAALEERLRKTDGKFIEDPKMKELIGNWRRGSLSLHRQDRLGRHGHGAQGLRHEEQHASSP
jgi:tetratricopeptide (TPR) repeat protein